MNLDTLTTIITSAAPMIAALSPAAVWAGRRIVAMNRTITALERAVDQHDAQNRGVVLVVTYPAMPRESSAVPWLRSCGWTVVEYDSTQYPGGDLPTGDRWRSDLETADVVLLQGTDVEQCSRIARSGFFRESLRPGSGVLLMVPNTDTRYRLAEWGDLASGITNPRRAEIETRGIVAARRAMALHMGTQRGGLAEARRALVG